MKWIVELEVGVYLADGEGGPARTMIAENAKQFASHLRAGMARMYARTYMPFTSARLRVYPLSVDDEVKP